MGLKLTEPFSTTPTPPLSSLWQPPSRISARLSQSVWRAFCLHPAERLDTAFRKVLTVPKEALVREESQREATARQTTREEDSMTTEQRAMQVWSVLVLAARNQQILSYTVLEDLIGVPRFGLAPILKVVAEHCTQ